MYLATLWSYLAGFAAVAFVLAPTVYLAFGVSPVTSYGAAYLAFFLPYVVATQLLLAAVGYGRTTWRGHRYVIALFPVWIRAVVSAVAEVWLHRPLRVAAVPRSRVEGSYPWRLVWPQVSAAVVLVLALLVGFFRLGSGAADSAVGTAVNVAWAGYVLLLLTPIVRPALTAVGRGPALPSEPG
jgi:cellulose synthase (UDP-forming)